jgi:hypothetical protein
MIKSGVKRLAAAPLLSFAIVHGGIAYSVSSRVDVMQSVAHALIAAPDSLQCMVLPDSLRPETSGYPPFKVCSSPGEFILRERGESIVWLEVRYRDGTQQDAQRTVDSIVSVLRPILGEARHCHWPSSFEWKAPGYQASIQVEPSSDMVRPDNKWGAYFEIERDRNRAPCDPP